jgi:hypothetical protein
MYRYSTCLLPYHSQAKTGTSLFISGLLVIGMSGCIAAITTGRSASGLLHHYATCSNDTTHRTGRSAVGSRILMNSCGVSMGGEILGMLVAAYLGSWSMQYHRPSPFNATSLLWLPSLLYGVLTILSTALHTVDSHDNDGENDDVDLYPPKVI